MNILIFGGTKGIGLSLANLCSSAAHVIISGRSQPDNCEHDFFACDVSSHDEVNNTIDYVVKKFGTIDVVINSAGYGHCKSLDEISIEEWERMNRVTVDGNFYIAKYAYDIFKKQKYGHFITIGSMASGGSWGKEIGYGTLKGAQAKFGMHLMNQFESDNQVHGTQFFCHVICPGSVYTGFWDNIPERSITKEESLSPKDVASVIQSVIHSPSYGYSELSSLNSKDYLDIGPLPPFDDTPNIIKVAHNAHP